MKQANGAIIYKGPSQIDGKNIVVIVTGLNSKTANAKTGDMLQTWILLDNVSPMEAVKTGQDESICGGCKHRGRLELIAGKWIWIKKRTCYVTVWQAPRAIWEAFKRGSYTDMTKGDISSLGKDRNVRLGAYGDPAAVPVSIWQDLTMFADTTTGYTHQWQDKANAALKYLTMASADSITEYKQAIKAGWRTFRVKKPSDHAMKGETVCPNTTVGLNCADCGACKGLKGSSPLKGNIVIDVHGSGAAAFA
tara:strand:- start:2247 stop:2996 length:750 start_codon:yes stop_codon:yes gene_type:complete